MIPPGTYRLDCDLVNPRPDRRKRRDWRAVPVWSSGDEFIVEEQRAFNDHTYTVVRMVGSAWSHQNIGPGAADQYRALASALVPVAESTPAMFERLDVSGGFSRWLVESGAMSNELFEKLWQCYMEHDHDSDCPVPSAIRLTERT